MQKYLEGDDEKCKTDLSFNTSNINLFRTELFNALDIWENLFTGIINLVIGPLMTFFSLSF